MANNTKRAQVRTETGVVPILTKFQRHVFSIRCAHAYEIRFSREKQRTKIPGALAASSDTPAQDGIHSPPVQVVVVIKANTGIGRTTTQGCQRTHYGTSSWIMA